MSARHVRIVYATSPLLAAADRPGGWAPGLTATPTSACPAVGNRAGPRICGDGKLAAETGTATARVTASTGR